jgi:hypothetical protein
MAHRDPNRSRIRAVGLLHDQNVTNGDGLLLLDQWSTHGRAAPVAMAADSATFTPLGVPAGAVAGEVRLAVGRNPFAGTLGLRLDLPAPAAVRLEIYDPQGRRLIAHECGALGAGEHRLTWDGRDAAGIDRGAGVFWARVIVDRVPLTRRVVRLR